MSTRARRSRAAGPGSGPTEREGDAPRPGAAPLVSIRPAQVADAPAMGRVFVDAFHAGHRGQIPDRLLELRTYEGSARAWARALADLAAAPAPEEGILVAEDAAAGLVGVAMGGPAKPWAADRRARAARATGEVYTLYVDPAHQRRGIGRALVGHLARGLAARGRGRLLIGVLAANAPARRFYEALGGRLLDHRPFEDEGVRLDEAVYVWDDTGSLLPTPPA